MLYRSRMLIPLSFSLCLISSVSAQVNVGAKGTTQMAGADGKFLRPYSLGKKTYQLNFTLKSVEYTLDPVKIGGRTTVAGPGEKLMVIRFNIHNCEKKEQYVSGDCFKLTAVDATETTKDNANYIGLETTKQPLAMPLKPAQKLDCYAVFKVVANGEIPKLIVMRAVEPVVRYNLLGKAKLPVADADPSDPTNATVATELKGSIGTPFITDTWQVTLTSVGQPIAEKGRVKARRGYKLVPIEATVKNLASAARYVNVLPLEFKGEGSKSKATYKIGCYDKFGESAAQNVDIGKSVNVTLYFELADGDALKLLQAITNSKRTYTFEF